MSAIVILLLLVTGIETYVVGFGLTILLALPSRIGYILNTYGIPVKVKTCLKWEIASLVWACVRTVLFRQGLFDTKRVLIVLAFSIVALVIEYYDSTAWSYIVTDAEGNPVSDDVEK